MTEQESETRDRVKHDARNQLINQYARTFGLSRESAGSEFLAHLELDEEERRERLLRGPIAVRSPRKRRSEKRALMARNEIPA